MTKHTKKSAGFSFVETLTTVAALAIVAAVATTSLAKIRSGAKTGKLKAEVISLNAAVKSYVTSGGEIKPTDTAVEVLELLKAELSKEDAAKHVGYVGSFVDQRLTGTLINEETPGTRVVWNFNARKFETTTALVPGIGAFELNQDVAESTKTRKAAAPFTYSTDQEGWVWEYGEPGTKFVITPTQVDTAPNNEVPVDPILITLTPKDFPTPPNPDDVPPPVDPNRLSAPSFSIGGGTYPLADYRLDLEILNPNDPETSRVFYRSGSSWAQYEPGRILNISPETEIDAFVFSLLPQEHASSTLASSSYRSDPVQLELSLDADSTNVSYDQLVSGDVRVRWNVTNLNAVPEYLKTPEFFTTYWTDDSSDPAFAGRNRGERYTEAYNGESIRLNPSLWDGNGTFEISAYAESRDTTWIQHSEKPSLTITAKRENLPAPEVELQELGDGKFLVRLTPSGDMPPGAEIYYNSTGETMSFNASTGHVAEGTAYSHPFIWEPETTAGGNSGGATGTVNIDRGNGDIPIQQVVLKTNGNLVTQNQTVPFDPMIQPGADTMRGATVNDNSSSEITIESITINDNGNIIVADNVNVLNLQVSNLNYPDENLNRVTVYENGVKRGDANAGDFGTKLQTALKSKDLRDYVKYDGDSSLLLGTPFDFDVTFAPLRNNDYLVVGERFGNSTFDLEPLDASGRVIAGSNKVVIREYSWNTGYAPSDEGGQPMFLAVIDIEQFGVDTNANSITGFRVNNDGGADFKFFTISDDSFENRPVNFEGDLTAAAYPPANLANWFNPSSATSTSVDGNSGPPELEDPVEATINFKKLTTSAGFLNEGFLVVNGVEYQFQTSDDPAGRMMDVSALFDENAINTIDLKIYTTPRLWIDGYLQPTYERQMSYHSALHGLKFLNPWESFAGASPDRAKVKDTSYSGMTRLEFGFEDLIDRDPYGWLDNDYNDYNFQISMPSWVKFDFGGLHFNF